MFLTYSQVNPQLTHHLLLNQLKNKFNLFNFNVLIGKEVDQDGGIHYHVILTHFEKFQITNPKQLDIQYEQQTFHGTYSSVKQLRQAVSYVCKDNDYITNFENLIQGRLLTAKEFIIKHLNEKGVEQALIDYYNTTPDKAIAGLSVSALKRHFSDIQRLKDALQMDKIDTPFSLDSFKVHPEVQQWMHNPKHTLFLVGSSGIGKTQFCKAFVKQNQLKTLLVSHRERFRRLDRCYDAIIIDDANIHEFEETQLLTLIDNQVDKTLRVLYNAVVKKAGVIQLIAMNQNESRKLATTLTQERFARRILLHKPERPFILNLTVNININNNTNNNTFNLTPTINSKPLQDKDWEQQQQEEQLHAQGAVRKIKQIAGQPV